MVRTFIEHVDVDTDLRCLAHKSRHPRRSRHRPCASIEVKVHGKNVQRTERLGRRLALQFTWLCKYDHKAWAALLAGCLPEGFSR